MNTLKPGTRCECREDACTHHAEHHPQDVREGAVPAQCSSTNAVRLVTVRDYKRVVVRSWGDTENQQEYAMRDVEERLAMCEPCATWHEQKG